MTWLDDRSIDVYARLEQLCECARRWCYRRRLAAERRHCKRGGWRLW